MKKNGNAVTETMYHLSLVEKNQKQKQQEAFLRNFLDKNQECKQKQEALILKKMEEISKREKVLQVIIIT